MSIQSREIFEQLQQSAMAAQTQLSRLQEQMHAAKFEMPEIEFAHMSSVLAFHKQQQEMLARMLSLSEAHLQHELNAGQQPVYTAQVQQVATAGFCVQ